MAFYDKLKTVLDQRKQLTENGAVAFETSGSALVDMNYKIPSYRDADEQTILNDFLKAYSEDPELAIKWMFYAGDIRQGLGERRLFKILVKNVLPAHPHLISLIPEYSRWDVVTELLDTRIKNDVAELIKDQLQKDNYAMKNNKPASLMAKWLPSINTSSKETVRKATILSNLLGMPPAIYRKTLAALRKYLDVTEVKACANQWDKIDYEKVPSKANLLYKEAFMKHDPERRQQFIDALSKGEVKVNAGALFPHEIVHRYISENYWGESAVKETDYFLESMWKALPKKDAYSKPVIVVRDGSGSMECNVSSKSKVTALDIATALAIYFSENAHADFKDKFITFSERPKLVDLSNLDSLRDKVARAYKEVECSNTNIEKTFQLILDTAVANDMKQEDIPDILIISDMEFDASVGSNSSMATCYCSLQDKNPTLFDDIAKQWKTFGYELPSVTFWNVNSRTNSVPMQKNKLGVKLVSGFSQNVLDLVMNSELTPFDALKNILTGERYSPIALEESV